jgi:PKD repeat protein
MGNYYKPINFAKRGISSRVISKTLFNRHDPAISRTALPSFGHSSMTDFNCNRVVSQNPSSLSLKYLSPEAQKPSIPVAERASFLSLEEVASLGKISGIKAEVIKNTALVGESLAGHAEVVGLTEKASLITQALKNGENPAELDGTILEARVRSRTIDLAERLFPGSGAILRKLELGITNALHSPTFKKTSLTLVFASGIVAALGTSVLAAPIGLPLAGASAAVLSLFSKPLTWVILGIVGVPVLSHFIHRESLKHPGSGILSVAEKAIPPLASLGFFGMAAQAMGSQGVSILLPWGPTASLIALGLPLSIFTFALAKSFFQCLRERRDNVEPRTTISNIVRNHLCSGLAMATTSTYMLYRFMVTGKYAIVVGGAVLSNVFHLSLFGPGGILLGLTLGLYLNRRQKRAQNMGPDNENPLAPNQKSKIAPWVTGTGIGLGANALGMPGINLIAASLLLSAEAHASWNSIKNNWGMIGNLKHKWLLTSDQEVEEASKADGEKISMTKPFFNPDEFLLSVYTTALTRKGSNYQLIGLCDVDPYESPKSRTTALKNREVGRYINDMLRDLYQEIKISYANGVAQFNQNNLPVAYQGLIELYTKLSVRYSGQNNGLWRGKKFGTLGIKKIGNDELVGKNGQDRNDFHATLGSTIKDEGEGFKRKAEWLQERLDDEKANPGAGNLSREEIEREYQDLIMRYGTEIVVFFRKEYRNLSPKETSKIENMFRYYARLGLTLMEVLRKDKKTGDIYKELLPCKKIRYQKGDEATAWRTLNDDQLAANSTSPDLAGIDNTGQNPELKWRAGFNEQNSDPIIWTAWDAEKNIGPSKELLDGWKWWIDMPPRTIHFDRAKYTENIDAEFVDRDLVELLISLKKNQEKMFIRAEYPKTETITLPWVGKSNHVAPLKKDPGDKLTNVQIQRSAYNIFAQDKDQDKDGKWHCVPWKPPKVKVLTETIEGLPAGINGARLEKDKNGNWRMKVSYKDGHVEDYDPPKRLLERFDNDLSQVEKIEIDLGKSQYAFNMLNTFNIGSLKVVKYTFMGEDGKPYYRYLPMDKEQPPFEPATIDYAKLNDFINDKKNSQAKNFSVEALSYVGQKHPYDPKRSLFDPGVEQDPKAILADIVNPQEFFAANKLNKSEYVIGVGFGDGRKFFNFSGKIRDYEKIIDQQKTPNGLKLIRKTDHLMISLKDAVRFQKNGAETSYDHITDHPYFNWVQKVKINPDRSLTITFKNPDDPNPQHIWEETCRLSVKETDKIPGQTNTIYQENLKEYQPRLFSMSITQDRKKLGYLELTVKEEKDEEICISDPGVKKALNNADEVSIIKVKAGLKFELLDETSGEPTKKYVLVPSDQEIYKPENVHFEHNPESPIRKWTSALTWGDTENIFSPQNIVIPTSSTKDQGNKSGTQEQKQFFCFNGDAKYSPEGRHLSGIGGVNLVDRSGHGSALFTGTSNMRVLPHKLWALINEEIIFDGSKNSFPSSGQITQYHWDIRDQEGNIVAQSDQQNFRHKFARPGIYSATLSVTDTNGIKYSEKIPRVEVYKSDPKNRTPNVLTWEEEDIETGNRLEVDLEWWKSIVEDAQRSWEANIFYGDRSQYDLLNHTIGGGPGKIGKLLVQRGRWEAFLGFGRARTFRYLLPDSLYALLPGRALKNKAARLMGREYPPLFTFHQWYDWFNTSMWYYDGWVKYVMASAPSLFQLTPGNPEGQGGFAPLIADPRVFPGLWGSQYGANTVSYLNNMASAGVGPFRALWSLQGIYYLIVPTLARGGFKSIQTALGPFASTGVTPAEEISPWNLRQTWVYFCLVNVVAAGLGIYRLGIDPATRSRVELGGREFGPMTNTFWPAYLALLSSWGLLLYEIERYRNTQYKNFFKFFGEEAELTYEALSQADVRRKGSLFGWSRFSKAASVSLLKDNALPRSLETYRIHKGDYPKYNRPVTLKVLVKTSLQKDGTFEKIPENPFTGKEYTTKDLIGQIIYIYKGPGNYELKAYNETPIEGSVKYLSVKYLRDYILPRSLEIYKTLHKDYPKPVRPANWPANKPVNVTLSDLIINFLRPDGTFSGIPKNPFTEQDYICLDLSDKDLDKPNANLRGQIVYTYKEPVNKEPEKYELKAYGEYGQKLE